MQYENYKILNSFQIHVQSPGSGILGNTPDPKPCLQVPFVFRVGRLFCPEITQWLTPHQRYGIKNVIYNLQEKCYYIYSFWARVIRCAYTHCMEFPYLWGGGWKSFENYPRPFWWIYFWFLKTTYYPNFQFQAYHWSFKKFENYWTSLWK